MFYPPLLPRLFSRHNVAWNRTAPSKYVFFSCLGQWRFRTGFYSVHRSDKPSPGSNFLCHPFFLDVNHARSGKHVWIFRRAGDIFKRYTIFSKISKRTRYRYCFTTIECFSAKIRCTFVTSSMTKGILGRSVNKAWFQFKSILTSVLWPL